MNANEGDLAIILMRLMGIPQEMRHKIYMEACDEVEVLQDVTSGTVDALSTVLKWVRLNLFFSAKTCQKESVS